MASNNDKDDKVAEFCSITAADPEFASSFLEAADWNVNSAIELYIGNVESNTPSSSSNRNAAGGGRMNNNNSSSLVNQGGFSSSSFGHGEDLEDINNNNDDYQEEEESQKSILIREKMEQFGLDELTARAIVEAEGSNAKGGEDGVRAPILQKRARLFDVEPHGHLHNNIGPFGNAFGMAFATGAIPMFEAAMRGTVGNNNRQPDVYDMFGPPHHLLFNGTFEELRKAAKTQNKWILVNIQEQEEFQSLVLNRDLWSDEIVREIVQQTFVFWQRQHNTEDAKKYIQLYNPPRPFPHVCILDPRTGEKAFVFKLGTKREKVLRESFMDQVSHFLDSHPLGASAGSSSGGGELMMKKKVINIANDEEEEEEDSQLADAIRASLTVNNGTTQQQSIPKATISTLSHSTSAAAAAATTTTTQQKQDLGFNVRLEVGEEPPKSDASTLIQFTNSDGSKTKRRFLKSATVEDLYAFVYKVLLNSSSGAFTLVTVSPKRNLKDLLQATLVEADVCNSSINIVRE